MAVRHMFDPSFTRVAVSIFAQSDGSTRVGYVDASGKITDVSAMIAGSPSSGFSSSVITHRCPSFDEETGGFTFRDDTVVAGKPAAVVKEVDPATGQPRALRQPEPHSDVFCPVVLNGVYDSSQSDSAVWVDGTHYLNIDHFFNKIELVSTSGEHTPQLPTTAPQEVLGMALSPDGKKFAVLTIHKVSQKYNLYEQSVTLQGPPPEPRLIASLDGTPLADRDFGRLLAWR